MKSPLWKMSWLDRKIRLAKECVNKPIHRENAEQIFVESRSMYDTAVERRTFSEAAFLERCKKLLMIVAAVRKHLDGAMLEQASLLEDVLLTYVTVKKS